MKELPKIYKIPTTIKNKNNTEKCLVQEEKDTIESIIDSIFASNSYEKKVRIETKEKVYEETYLIQKKENSIITWQDEIIPISSIESITLKN